MQAKLTIKVPCAGERAAVYMATALAASLEDTDSLWKESCNDLVKPMGVSAAFRFQNDAAIAFVEDCKLPVKMKRKTNGSKVVVRLHAGGGQIRGLSEEFWTCIRDVHAFPGSQTPRLDSAAIAEPTDEQPVVTGRSSRLRDFFRESLEARILGISVLATVMLVAVAALTVSKPQRPNLGWTALQLLLPPTVAVAVTGIWLRQTRSIRWVT